MIRRWLKNLLRWFWKSRAFYPGAQGVFRGRRYGISGPNDQVWKMPKRSDPNSWQASTMFELMPQPNRLDSFMDEKWRTILEIVDRHKKSGRTVVIDPPGGKLDQVEIDKLGIKGLSY